MDHTPSQEDHVSSVPQDTCIHLSPIPEPSTTSNMNGDQDDQDPNLQPQNEPVSQDPIIEPAVKNPIIIPQQPLNPLPDDDPVDDNRPLALQCPKQNITAPGEWWKVKTPQPQTVDSSSKPQILDSKVE